MLRSSAHGMRRDRPDAAWKQRQLDYLEKNFERSHTTEAERQGPARVAQWCDHIIANDWDELERRARKAARARERGALLPPEASDTERCAHWQPGLRFSAENIGAICPAAICTGRTYRKIFGC